MNQRSIASATPGKTSNVRTAQALVSLLVCKNKDGAKLLRRMAMLSQRAGGTMDDQSLLPILQRLKPRDLSAVRASIVVLEQHASADPATSTMLPVLKQCVDAVALAAFQQSAGKTIQALLQKDASPAALNRQLLALAESTQALSGQDKRRESLHVLWHSLSAVELFRLNRSLSKLEQQHGAKLAPASAQALALLKNPTASASASASASRELLHHGTELLRAMCEGNAAHIERHGESMQAHHALLAAQSDPFTALEDLPSFPQQKASVKEALASKLQTPEMWQMAGNAASMLLLRYALRQVFGMNLPALPGSHHATDNAQREAQELIIRPASEHEQKLEIVGAYNVGESFYKDVKRYFDMRQTDGTPLMPGSEPGMDDKKTQACILAAMPTLVDICHGDVAKAQALTTLSSQTLFASIQMALQLTMMEQPEQTLPMAGAYSVGFKNADTRPSIERNMIHFVKTNGNPELILHYQAEGGLFKPDDADGFQLDPASWVRATIRIELVSADPATFKILGTPMFEIMLHAPAP